jgi:carbon-monoxide dehydrogenase medium subunit
MRAREAEAYLKGKTLTESVIEKASEIAAGETAPISDIRAGMAYRKEMSRVIVKRCLAQTLQS